MTGMLHAEGDATPYIEGMVRRAADTRAGLTGFRNEDAAPFATMITKSIEPNDPDIIRARSGRLD